MTMKITRRQFLARTAIGLGATVLVCGGATTLAAITPPFELEEKMAEQGASKMKGRILVAYATRCGSTMEVAEAIAGELNRKGKTADVRAIKNVTDLSAYDAFVLGSAIRMGNWVPEALKFVEERQAELKGKAVAVFSVHMNNLGQDETSEAARKGYHEALKKFVTPTTETWFAGSIDYKKMAFVDRLICRAMKAPEVDRRDWTAIRQWSQQLANQLEERI